METKEDTKLSLIRTRNGEQILGYIVDIDDNFVTVKDPITIHFDLVYKVYANDMMILIDGDAVQLPIDAILFVGNANDNAQEYYDEFKLLSSRKSSTSINIDDSDEDYTDDEDLFAAIMESKGHTKQ